LALLNSLAPFPLARRCPSMKKASRPTGSLHRFVNTCSPEAKGAATGALANAGALRNNRHPCVPGDQNSDALHAMLENHPQAA
jgi:hypothetical protein